MFLNVRSLMEVCKSYELAFETEWKNHKLFGSNPSACAAFKADGKELLDKGKISCPSCHKLTNLGPYDVRDGLETDFETTSRHSDPNAVVRSDDHWCLVCSCIVSQECRRLKHETCSLSSEEGRELAESFLKTLMITCKINWNSASNKRREIDIKLSSVLTSLKAIQREIEQAVTKNRNELQCTEFLLEDVVNVLNTSKGTKNKSLSDFNTQFNKYNDLSRGSKLYVEEASADLEHANAVNECFTSVTNANGNEDTLVTGKSAVSNGSQACTHSKPAAIASEIASEKNECIDWADRKKVSNHDKSTKEGECQWLPTQRNNEDAALENSLDAMHVARNNHSAKARSEDQLSESKFSESPEEGSSARSVTAWSLTNKDSPKKSSSYKVYETFTLLKPPAVPIPHKKCFIEISVNDELMGRIVIMLDVAIAPALCRKFHRHCVDKKNGYTGSFLSKAVRRVYVMGGTIIGEDRLFEAPQSPLMKTRGAVYLAHRRNYNIHRKNIVRTEFGIQLAPKTPDPEWTSTVFGYVTEGLELCDKISALDCARNYVEISLAGAMF